MDEAALADILARGMAIIGEDSPPDRFGLLLRYVAEVERARERGDEWCGPARGDEGRGDEWCGPSRGDEGRGGGEEFVVRHVLDSLAPLPLLRALPEGPVADLGSGAGLPGIPLAIMMPGRMFSLVERSGRRARFLAGTLAALGLRDAEVLALDAEAAPEAAYGLVVARGFAVLDRQSLKIMRRLLAPGGAAAVYAGRRAEIDAELAAVPEARAEVLPYSAPFPGEERHLVVLRKD